MKNLLMDLDEMRYLMNHEEFPDGSWRNETAAASWRISWWTLDGCGSPIGSYAHFSQNDVHKGGLK